MGAAEHKLDLKLAKDTPFLALCIFAGTFTINTFIMLNHILQYKRCESGQNMLTQILSYMIDLS